MLEQIGEIESWNKSTQGNSSSESARPTPVRSSSANDRSPYLVNRLLNTDEKNLFNHVKFHFVKDELKRLPAITPHILDVGCGLQVAQRYLQSFDIPFDYLGVDYEAAFEPDAVIDLMQLDEISLKLPWQPDALLMLDVLEHLHEDPQELARVLGHLHSLCSPNCKLILTLPQMYRLDRCKLAHLHYPEHKIRLTQQEWVSIVKCHFHIESVRGFGVLSVIPYLPMASSWYRPDNRLGKLFTYLRSSFFEWPPFKTIDYWLSRAVCNIPGLKNWTNDIMIVATPRTPAREAHKG